jgi:hypothetical protein
MTDWATIKADAIDAAEEELTGNWNTVATSATAQIGALVDIAQYVEEHKTEMPQAQYQFLIDQHKDTLQSVLTGYEAIGLAMAQNAVNAVMQVIIAALPGLVGL